MHITERKEWKKVTDLSKTDLSERFTKFLDLLPSKLSSSQINTVAIFAKYNLENENMSLIDRFNSIQLLGRDSSSLNSLILRYGNDQGTNIFKEKNLKCKQTIEKYKQKYGDVIGQEKYRELCVKRSHSLNGYIMRYGDKEGKEKFQKFWETTNFSCSLDAFIRRHGEKEGKKKYQEYCKNCSIRINSMFNSQEWKTIVFKRILSLRKHKRDYNKTSLSSFIKRYGEYEGRQKYNEFLFKLKLNNPVCIEYYLSRGIDVHNAKSQIRKLQLSRFSKTYKASKESLKIFKPCYKFLRRNNFLQSEIYWGIGKRKEYFIVNKKTGKYSFYDFCIPKLKIIVEYNGSYFHPQKIDIDSNNTYFAGCNNIDDVIAIYNRDQEKIKLAESHGYKVLSLWATDGIKNNIEKCVKFLKENIYNGNGENS